MRKLFILLIISLSAASLPAEELMISQIDTSPLLFEGEIDLYFSLPGEADAGITAGDLAVAGTKTGPLEILSLEKGAGRAAGTDFLLLIDNSGDRCMKKLTRGAPG